VLKMHAETHANLHMKCPLLMSGLNQKFIWSRNFIRAFIRQMIWKSFQRFSIWYMRRDGRTYGETNKPFFFRLNYEHAKNGILLSYFGAGLSTNQNTCFIFVSNKWILGYHMLQYSIKYHGTSIIRVSKAVIYPDVSNRIWKGITSWL
jgi:hypothetical protein